MIKRVHHQQLKDVLENTDFIRGPFYGPEGREWRVLAEPVGRQPIKCFELSLDATRIIVGPGVVHNTYYPGQTVSRLEPTVVWLTYTATFGTFTANIDGTPLLYRLPGPSEVIANVITLPIGTEPVHHNDSTDPSYLTNSRKLGTITKVKNEWKLEGGTGIYPVAIMALGGFVL